MMKLRSIQCLRALAVVGVVAVHTLGSRALVGSYGVDLFFVISGFIISRTARRAPSAAAFLRARFLRVVPLYYIQTAPWILCTLLSGAPLLAAPLGATLLFWPVWGNRFVYPLLAVGWTLCFEALFYTSLGAVVKFGRRAATALLVGYAVALGLDLAGTQGAVQFLGSPLLLEFLLGAAISVRPVRERPRLGAAAIVGAGVWLLLWVVHGVGATPVGERALEPAVATLRIAIAAPAAGLLVWGALQLESLCKGRLAQPFSGLGDASYSIYLAHPLILRGVAGLWRLAGAPPAAAAPILICAGVAGGVLAYRTMEQPLLAAFRRGRTPQPVAVAAE